MFGTLLRRTGTKSRLTPGALATTPIGALDSACPRAIPLTPWWTRTRQRNRREIWNIFAAITVSRIHSKTLLSATSG